MVRHVTALITGAIRDRFEFLPLLSKLVQWRQAGLVDSIIFSTWYSSLEADEALLQKISSLGIGICLAHDMLEGGDRNIWRQYRLLDVGLRYCPEDAYVLRVRTDKTLHLLEAFRSVLTRAKSNFEEGARGPLAMFQEKVAVPLAAVNLPFFIKDLIFGGGVRDLRRLTHFELWFEMFTEYPGVEWQWKSAPFLREFPIFRQFFESYRIPAFTRALSERPEQTPDVLLRVLAAYYRCLIENFTCHVRPEMHSTQQTFEDILSGRSKTIHYSEGPHNAIFSMFMSTEQIEELVGGRLQASAVYGRLLTHMQDPELFSKRSFGLEDHEKMRQFLDSYNGIAQFRPTQFFPGAAQSGSYSIWNTLELLQFEDVLGTELHESEKSLLEDWIVEKKDFSGLTEHFRIQSEQKKDAQRAEHWRAFEQGRPKI